MYIKFTYTQCFFINWMINVIRLLLFLWDVKNMTLVNIILSEGLIALLKHDFLCTVLTEQFYAGVTCD